MKTVSLGIANYCVPCHAHCRYCLLSSCGQASGVDWRRGAHLAERVFAELAETAPGLSGNYYIGYCMGMPDLFDYIRFSREHGAPGGSFLQMNGFAFREEPELRSLMRGIRDAGVTLIDLTFYGTEEYHDRFAGRKGDFRLLMRMLSAAAQAELPVNASIPLLRSNLDQLSALQSALKEYPAVRFTCFLPHSKGRGRALRNQRITKQEFERLPGEIRAAFVKTPHQTEAEWLAAGKWEQPEKRYLTLVLTRENLPRLESMPAADILSFLEALDDRCAAQLPPIPVLAEKYGNPKNDQLFRFRDLLLHWQQQYIADTGNTMYDMHDETHHFSVHI